MLPLIWIPLCILSTVSSAGSLCSSLWLQGTSVNDETVLWNNCCFLFDEKFLVWQVGSFAVLHSEAMHILRASVSKCPWAQWSRAEVWAVPTAPPATAAAALAHSPPCLWQKIVQETSLPLCTPAPRKYHIIISDDRFTNACWFVSWHEEFNFKTCSKASD